jgi:hypothetical protein
MALGRQVRDRLSALDDLLRRLEYRARVEE